MGNCVSGNSQPRNSNPVKSAPTTTNKNLHNDPTNSYKNPFPNTTVRVDIHKMNNLSPILRPILPKNLV